MTHHTVERLSKLAELGGLSLTELAALSGCSHATFTNARSRGSEITLPTLRLVVALAGHESSQGRWLAWLTGASSRAPSSLAVKAAVDAARSRKGAA